MHAAAIPALMHACTQGATDNVREMMRYNPDTTLTDDNGSTAEKLAALHPETLAVLLGGAAPPAPAPAPAGWKINAFYTAVRKKDWAEASTLVTRANATQLSSDETSVRQLVKSSMARDINHNFDIASTVLVCRRK